MIKLNRTILFLALLALTALLGAGCSERAQKAKHLARAEKYFAAAQYDEASIDYRFVLRLDPTNRAVMLRLVQIYLEQGSPLLAMKTMQEYNLKSEDPLLRTRFAEFHFASGDRDLGRSEVLAVLRQYPTNTDALLFLPTTADTPEETTETATLLNQLTQQHPNCAGVYLARAGLMMRQKDLAAAEPLAQRALQLAPALPQAHLRMAEIYLLRTNRPAAEKAFAAAVKTAPLRSRIRVAYAKSKVFVGRLDEAREILTEINKKAPDYLPAALLLAGIELQENKPDAALELTQAAIRRDPSNLEARQLQGQALIAKGQAGKAARQWEEFDQRLIPNPYVKLLVAKACLANRENTRASALLDQVVQLSSNRLDSVELEARLIKGRLDSRINPPVAVESMRQLLTRTNILQAKFLLLDAYRNSRRFDEAATLCRDMIKAAPQNPSLPFLLGTVLREQGRLAEARTAFIRSIEMSPGNLMAVSRIVDIDIGTTNQAAALKLVQAEASKQTNAIAAFKFLEGRIYASRKQWAQAESASRAALDIDPGFSNAYQLLSSIYLANTNLAGAIRELESLATKRTNDIPSLMTLGTLYESTGDFGRAAGAYDRVLAFAPQLYSALNNLACLYCEKLNQLDKAADLAQKARQLAPQNPSVADTLGWVLHKQGDNQKALPLLQEAAEKIPDHSEVLYHLGVTSYMLGQTAAAKSALERALASPASLVSKAEAQSYLARLSGTASVAGSGGDSIAQLEKLVKSQPQDLTARMRLAALYEQGSQAAKAAAEYEEVLRQNPRTAQAASRLAQLNAGPLNNRARALELARKAHDLAPDDPESSALLGRLVYANGDHAQAYSLLQPAAQKLPRRADVHYDAAWAAYSVGRVAEADKLMRGALQADPAFKQAEAARSFAAMTALHLNPQGLAQAEGQIQQLLKSDPNYAPALMAQAALLRTKGDAKTAATLYAKVLTAFARFTPAIRELGLLYANDPAQAQKAYELLVKTWEAAPEDMEVARAVGIVSYQRKDYRNAIAPLQASLRARPNDPDALFCLGMSLCQTRDMAQGKDQLQKAIAAGLKEPMLSEAKRLLGLAAAK